MSDPPWNATPSDPDVACNKPLIYLESELDRALYNDEHQLADSLRDKISTLQMGSYVDILNANIKFYKAFSSGSMVDISASWLRDPKISCKHPLGELFTGFWEVVASFEALLAAGIPSVAPSNMRVSMRGSLAIVTCEENASLQGGAEEGRRERVKEWNENFSSEPADIVMTATNIFEKKNGQWYLIHHVSSPTSPAM